MKLIQGGAQFLARVGVLTNFLQLQPAQIPQPTAPQGLISHPRAHRTLSHAIDGALSPGGQLNMTTLLQFDQQRATGHVFDLARRVAPVPLFTQRLGQSPPAPAGMVGEELADESQFGETQPTALEGDRHAPKMPEAKTGVQRKIKNYAVRYQCARGMASIPWISSWSSSGRKLR